MFLDNDTFDLELEDLIAPPPLSQSAPELGTQLPVSPLMRAAVSSTELLYEKAMARLYQAVEYEESENARKRSESMDKEALRRRSYTVDDELLRINSSMNPQETAMTRLRINSLTDGERRSTLKRRLSGDAGLSRRLSFRENESDVEDSSELSKIPETIKKSLSPLVVAPKEEDGNFSDDYTDSTASSGDLSVPSEKIAPLVVRQSRQSRDDAEMDTYHPRMLSPYRRVNPEDAVEVLSKPLSPLPDPNFVPKPILKRSSMEFGIDEKYKKQAPEKPERKSLAQFFGSRSPSKSPTPSPKEIRKINKDVNEAAIINNAQSNETHNINVPTEIPEIKIEQPQIYSEVEPPVISPSEIAKKKKLEKRQSSLEENKVAADFYGDIIREVGAHLKKPKIPIYMNPEALKMLEMEDEDVEENISTVVEVAVSPVKESGVPFRQIHKQPSDTLLTKETRPQLIQPDREIDRPLPHQVKQPAILMERPMSPLVSQSKEPVIARPKSNSLQYNVGFKEYDENIIEPSKFKEVVSSSKTGTIPKRRSASVTKSRDSSLSRNTELPITHPSQQPSAVQQKIIRREKGSSRNRSESKSPATLSRRVMIKKENPSSPTSSSPIVSSKNITPASSPSLSRAVTPSELKEEIEIKAKSNISYVTDISLLVFATWLYFFKHALLALPILLLLLYRQLGEAIKDQIPDWMKRKKS